MKNYNLKPKLYIHVGLATHFLRWELYEFSKYFQLVDQPGNDTVLIIFGPDVLDEGVHIPALKRFAVLFPGFGYNPLHNMDLRLRQLKTLKKYERIFINPGPLEIAYKGVPNISLYQFSIDTSKVGVRKYRTKVNSLIHVSNDGAQKDWQRSQRIMELTGLKNEVYPPREHRFYQSQVDRNNRMNKFRQTIGLKPRNYLPYGYVRHELVIKKYQQYDGFVHVASDVKHKDLLDGKYTASLIEAGLTGSILFWHDTFNLGNNLKTVFALPLDPHKAAEAILDISGSIDVFKHSVETREEMIETFNVERSVKTRAEIMINLL